MIGRLIAAAGLALLVGAAAPPPGYDAFGLALLQRLSAPSRERNVFISPVSIGVALAMAAEGARGETREALLSGLHAGGDLSVENRALLDSIAANADAQVAIADAIWLRHDLPPRAEYVATLRDYYRAQATAVKFGDPSAAAAINAWTREHTMGLIDGIVDQTSPSDFAYLTNALAFKGKWASPFDHSNTRPHPFTDGDGMQHNVNMMFQNGFFAVDDERTYRALIMPYGKGGYAAYILMPTGNDAQSLLRDLDASTFGHIKQAATNEELDVAVPRFTLEYDADLTRVLATMGMASAFSDAADFSTMHRPPPGIHIASVVHKTYLRIDEEGTTAAAATSVGMRLTAIRVGPSVAPFIVDHPFVIAIRDERNGALLFLGAVNSIPPG